MSKIRWIKSYRIERHGEFSMKTSINIVYEQWCFTKQPVFPNKVKINYHLSFTYIQSRIILSVSIHQRWFSALLLTVVPYDFNIKANKCLKRFQNHRHRTRTDLIAYRPTCSRFDFIFSIIDEQVGIFDTEKGKSGLIRLICHKNETK